MGQTTTWADWGPFLAPQHETAGAYFIPAGTLDWGFEHASYVPDRPASDDPGDWHPEDALLVPLTDSDGELLGIVSVDEPVSGRRPDAAQLELVALACAHAAAAIEHAQATAAARRHSTAVEHLLRVSARLGAGRSLDDVLAEVCAGIRDALGFQRVAACLPAAGDAPIVPRAWVGWSEEDSPSSRRPRYRDIRALFAPEGLQEGCALYELEEAHAMLPDFMHDFYPSERNGRGPRAWDRHWLVVPLYDRDDGFLGLIWADDPEDRLLPTPERLQALRAFANQAATAVESAGQLAGMRHLAEHDPLTGLRNRRGFREGIDAHIAGRARSRCSSATWTTSSASTTRWATRRATRCSPSSRRCCATAPARPTCRRGWAARSSPWCCRGRGDRGDGGGRAPAPRRARALRRASGRGLRVDRRRDVRAGDGERRRADARRQPRALRRQAPRPRPLRRRPRGDARHARRGPRGRRLGPRAARRRDAAGRDARPARRRHRPALRDRRPLRGADRARPRLGPGAGRPRPRGGDPARHRQARHLRRDPPQARQARRRGVGGDGAPPRAGRAHPRARQPARHRGLGARAPRADRRRRLPAPDRRGRDPRRGPDPRGRGRLRGDDRRPALPPCAPRGRRARAARARCGDAVRRGDRRRLRRAARGPEEPRGDRPAAPAARGPRAPAAPQPRGSSAAALAMPSQGSPRSSSRPGTVRSVWTRGRSSGSSSSSQASGAATGAPGMARTA